ncbi:ligase-associated DNA damage response endonuclease PdeM [Stieleria varia]|uniref:Calcineurin-like phosphoesterase n=1 Tax=Stieleria varia TaxID=2528005 RepID=A0A5C6AT63_9BACT|nr:ligase-associated DNA damage response endonuclease PdeM [Stieleria varia]TWU02601.1 Calcineurin-like phosphoesterase [Stieleria varia]
MPDSIDIQLADNTFTLYADRGLFWPAQSILFVADTHFGKEATFRRGGIPVPVGTTDATLATIARMLHRTNANRLCVLGDMFHAKSSIAAHVCESLLRFFEQFHNVEVMLVRGNHDLRVGALPISWPITVIDPGIRIRNVALGHHPADREAEFPSACELYLCGHIHPAIQVSSRIDRLGKRPCFWHSRGQVVLPAIGDFTGTHVIKPSAGDTTWVVAENEIFRHPCHRR